MQIGIVGLGRMGANIARRLMRSGHQCVVFDANLDASLALGARRDLVGRAAGPGEAAAAPRTVWLMLPAGAVTEKAIADCPGCSRAATPSSTAATASGRTTSRAPREAARARHPLSRRRHQRRRVGARARLLPDDRRREGGRRTARSGVRRARARGRGHRANAASRGARSAARAGLSACRAQRRRAFRQDDPQRHRIRHDAGLRGRLRHPEARGR